MDQQATKKCNNCGATIPKNAAYCDICGALCSKRNIAKTPSEINRIARRKEVRDRIISRILLVLGLIFVGLIVIGSISSRYMSWQFEKWQEQQDISSWEETVTAEEFEKIDVGMTYEEIVEIIGGEGKKTEDSSYVISYSWPGEYRIGNRHGRLDIYIYLSYSDTKERPVTYIRESSIVDGAEVYEVAKLIDEYEYEKIDAPVVTKEQVQKISEGMTYEDVCEILGEGKLCASSTTIDEYERSVSKTYVWRSRYSDYDSKFELTFDDGILKYYSDWMKDHID